MERKKVDEMKKEDGWKERKKTEEIKTQDKRQNPKLLTCTY